MIVSSFSSGTICGTSYTSTDAAELARGNYDLALISSSWDSRCVSALNVTHFKASVGVGLFFLIRDNLGLRDKHDPEVKKFLQTRCATTKFIEGASCDVSVLWSQIIAIVDETRSSLKRPLKMFIDLSTCPRFLTLGLVAEGMLKGLASEIAVFYAEGQYIKAKNSTDLTFTGGQWSTVAVPLLAGLYNPNKESFYLVAVGFEGDKTYRAVSRADPDRVALLMTRPGVRPAYERKARTANQDLIKEFRIRRNDIIGAPAADAVGTWKALAESQVLKSAAGSNCFYLPCSTKPHALAMALNAIALGYPAVLYNVPEEHRVVQTRPTGQFWLYKLNDLAALAH